MRDAVYSSKLTHHKRGFPIVWIDVMRRSEASRFFDASQHFHDDIPGSCSLQPRRAQNSGMQGTRGGFEGN